jgi:predicted membrane protein
MKDLNKLVANIAMLAVILSMEAAAMIYGWGLKPRSWWWIIGIGFFANIGVRILSDKMREEGTDKK